LAGHLELVLILPPKASFSISKSIRKELEILLHKIKLLQTFSCWAWIVSFALFNSGESTFEWGDSVRTVLKIEAKSAADN